MKPGPAIDQLFPDGDIHQAGGRFARVEPVLLGVGQDAVGLIVTEAGIRGADHRFEVPVEPGAGGRGPERGVDEVGWIEGDIHMNVDPNASAFSGQVVKQANARAGIKMLQACRRCNRFFNVGPWMAWTGNPPTFT